jgi:hypothetical protein
MTNTYTWAISSMSCYPEAEGETDVVFQVNWICTASDGQDPITPPAVRHRTRDLRLAIPTPRMPISRRIRCWAGFGLLRLKPTHRLI